MTHTHTHTHTQDDIIDSFNPLMLIAEVQQHEVSQPAPPTNGTPAITDLSNDYIIRQPAVAMGEVSFFVFDMDVCGSAYENGGVVDGMCATAAD